MRLILASASARRRELLAAAGVPFVVDPADIDERRYPGEPAQDYARRVAVTKAHVVSERHPLDVVLGADTVVLVENEVLGKPVTPEDAAGMLVKLSGRAHDVLTSVAIEWPGGTRSLVETTRVWFANLDPEQIRWYVASGEAMDKAGGYAIQGLASRFVTRIEGSYSNVVGLPVAAVLQFLRANGLDPQKQTAKSLESQRAGG